MQHVVDRGGLLIETDVQDDGFPALLSLPTFNWIQQEKTSRPIGPIPDGVAWAEIDRDSLSREVLKIEKRFGRQPVIEIYTGDANVRPTGEERYGFFAIVGRREYFADTKEWKTEPVREIEMRYRGVSTEGYYQFEVFGEHQGDFYKGTSGAPIGDSEGIVVAVVKGGIPEARLILGAPVWPLKYSGLSHDSPGPTFPQ